MNPLPLVYLYGKATLISRAGQYGYMIVVNYYPVLFINIFKKFTFNQITVFYLKMVAQSNKHKDSYYPVLQFPSPRLTLL